MYRWTKPSDFDALGLVMFDAIHAVPSPYSAAQRLAWLPRAHSGPDWAARLCAQRVAVLDQGGPRGFATLRADGYLDMIFLAPEARGQGHFRGLMTMLTQEAENQKMPELTTHASLAAQGPFLSLGFELVCHETVSRDGQTLARAYMRRPLHAIPPVPHHPEPIPRPEPT
ncbi:GNAT family N-acetyltransferase [Primorskyibacter sp. 2E107]|uniref:GNAT family N-acetyltransferase n=1 Tax=Primorskyibacter sp. 2E107 TaxID=3403458 RepID=UPI003AF78084